MKCHGKARSHPNGQGEGEWHADRAEGAAAELSWDSLVDSLVGGLEHEFYIILRLSIQLGMECHHPNCYSLHHFSEGFKPTSKDTLVEYCRETIMKVPPAMNDTIMIAIRNNTLVDYDSNSYCRGLYYLVSRWLWYPIGLGNLLANQFFWDGIGVFQTAPFFLALCTWYNVGPQFTIAFSWCVYNFNFTFGFMILTTIVFMGFIKKNL